MKFFDKEVNTMDELNAAMTEKVTPIHQQELAERNPIGEAYESQIAPARKAYAIACDTPKLFAEEALKTPYAEFEESCAKARDIANKKIEAAKKRFEKIQARFQKQFDEDTKEQLAQLNAEIEPYKVEFEARMKELDAKYDEMIEPINEQYRAIADQLQSLEGTESGQ